MTPEQFLYTKGISSDTTIGIEGDYLLPELLQDYADLLKPQWIPIIDGDLSGLPDETIWITGVSANNNPFVTYQGGIWVKELYKDYPVITAWMPYTEPTPYQP